MVFRNYHALLIALFVFKMYGMEVNGSPQQQALHTAIQRNQLSVVEEILTHHTSLMKSTDKQGNNALHYLSSLTQTRPNIARCLINNDSSLVNAVNNNGQTPLHRAVQENKFYLVRILLENKADLNAQDNHSQTSVHYLADKSNQHLKNFVKIFKDYKVNLDIRDDNNETIEDKLKKNAPNEIHFQARLEMLNTLKN